MDRGQGSPCLGTSAPPSRFLAHRPQGPGVRQGAIIAQDPPSPETSEGTTAGPTAGPTAGTTAGPTQQDPGAASQNASEAPEDPTPISTVLDKAEDAGRFQRVSIGEILRKIGTQSFPAVILMVALVASSPLSGIPGMSSLAALIIGLLLVQMAWGAEEIWLPRWIRRQRIPTARLSQAIGWLRWPVERIEPFLRPRLTGLTEGPGRILPMAVCFVIVLVLPILDFIPLTGSLAAMILALIAAGFLVQDGALVLLALGVLGAMTVALILLI